MFNFNIPQNNVIIFLLVVWEAYWKGFALWKAAKKGEIWWFLAIFLINFFGIISIFYLWKTKQLGSVVGDTLKILKLKRQ